MNKFIDLMGQKFGRLTVIQRAGFDKRRNSNWLCKCECGTEKIIAGRSLRRGHTKSCGCLRREIARKRGYASLIDLTGEKFGRLTVIRRIPNNKSETAMWLCRCECRKETIVGGYSLRSDNTKSCGCLKDELIGALNRIDFGVASMRSLINSYKIRAKKHGIKYKLTEKQFANLTQKDCYYCGAKPNNVFGRSGGTNGEYIYNGLDRVDNNKDYTIDNVVPCCKRCNRAKKNFTL